MFQFFGKEHYEGSPFWTDCGPLNTDDDSIVFV